MKVVYNYLTLFIAVHTVYIESSSEERKHNVVDMKYIKMTMTTNYNLNLICTVCLEQNKMRERGGGERISVFAMSIVHRVKPSNVYPELLMVTVFSKHST